ncbi:hypothetical protein TNIN_12221 [Trichonephila inaurata madagascariensis]|uniref:Uncharacterized protein n=1 Tax=Trichonephila inaurata madagascariensis TaxID=2747483 RepID=A0A8X6WQG0_9ARAC|nr:hypothetical protein TNIN_12221 [Trichonephila inaurata madagascariensis]
MIDKTETAKDATEEDTSQFSRKMHPVPRISSPHKICKEAKVAENDSVGATAPMQITNQYQALAGNGSIPDPDMRWCQLPRNYPHWPKIPNEHTAIVKEICQNFLLPAQNCLEISKIFCDLAH